jgi:hypothetical protein
VSVHTSSALFAWTFHVWRVVGGKAYLGVNTVFSFVREDRDPHVEDL